MLRHYLELKAAHPERVLLYRLGDFFECFFEDAITLSRLLELTLTLTTDPHADDCPSASASASTSP